MQKRQTDKPKFFLCGGALMCDRAIPGLTQNLSRDESRVYYGGNFFVCETIVTSAAKMIAEALGGEYVEK